MDRQNEHNMFYHLSFCLVWVVSHRCSSLCPPGFLLFKDFCMNEIDEAVPQLKFYEEVSLECPCACAGLDGIMGWVRD